MQSVKKVFSPDVSFHWFVSSRHSVHVEFPREEEGTGLTDWLMFHHYFAFVRLKMLIVMSLLIIGLTGFQIYWIMDPMVGVIVVNVQTPLPIITPKTKEHRHFNNTHFFKQEYRKYPVSTSLCKVLSLLLHPLNVLPSAVEPNKEWPVEMCRRYTTCVNIHVVFSGFWRIYGDYLAFLHMESGYFGNSNSELTIKQKMMSSGENLYITWWTLRITIWACQWHKKTKQVI